MNGRKFTRRKNGALLCTVMVRHHVDRDALVWAAARQHYRIDELTTRAKVMDAAVECLKFYGMDDSYEYEDDDKADAEALIDRLFPELKPQGNA